VSPAHDGWEGLLHEKGTPALTRDADKSGLGEADQVSPLLIAQRLNDVVLSANAARECKQPVLGNSKFWATLLAQKWPLNHPDHGTIKPGGTNPRMGQKQCISNQFRGVDDGGGPPPP
jgi:hypothetical protein